MMTEVLVPNRTPDNSITVQTRAGTDIPNCQSFESSRLEQAEFEMMKRRYPRVEYRNAPCPIYNCHGFAFASRRTGITDSGDIWLCLEEDGYTQIDRSNVLPGDVILYIAPDGDIEHSGIVISEPDPQLGVPRVVSKWGRLSEVVHWAHECPYTFSDVRYYRVTR